MLAHLQISIIIAIVFDPLGLTSCLMAQINLQNDYLSVRFDNFPFSHETEKFSSFLILAGSLIKMFNSRKNWQANTQRVE